MSSQKDYVLDISPPSPQDGVIKFTVSEPPSSLVRHKSKLIWAISTAFIAYISFIVSVNFNIILTREASSLLKPNRHELWVCTAAILTLVLIYCRQPRQDSLTVISNMGVQLHSQSSWKFINNHDKNVFIPLSNIIDLVVHEGFHGYGQVIFYMCVLTRSRATSFADNVIQDINKSEDIITVVFSEMLPRKDILVKVWKQSRQVLFGETRRYWRRVPGQGLKECS